MNGYWSELWGSKGGGHFERKFQGEGSRTPTTAGVRKLYRVPWAITWRCLRDLTFSRFDTYRRVTDTDTRRRLIRALRRAGKNRAFKKKRSGQ